MHDAAFPLDLQNRSDQQHLNRDAQLAEDLAIRYADFKHKEPFGYEGHGGLIEGGRVRNECMAKLVSIIKTNHAVTTRQVLDARTNRDWRFDVAVVLSFAALYWFGAIPVCRSLARRFTRSEQTFWLVAAVLTSVAVSAAGIQLLGLWSIAAEMIRVGNDHLSGFRGSGPPWGRHLAELFVTGVVLFWLNALLQYRWVARNKEFSDSSSGAVISNTLRLSQ